MEVAVIILAIIAGVTMLALVRELRSPRKSESQADLVRMTDELNSSKIRVAELEEAQRQTGSRLTEFSEERDEAKRMHDHLQRQLAEAREELRGLRSGDEARERALEERREELDTHFKGLASEIAHASNEEFRKQAAEDFKRQRELAEQELKQRVEPVGKSLEELRKQINDLEKQREGAYEGVSELIRVTQEQVGRLSSETGDLREILRSSRHRGQWGERALENILELGGMRRGKDFKTQVSGERGTSIADFVTRMPGGGRIIIDSKATFDEYRQALEAKSEPEQRLMLTAHAETVMRTARELSQRDYPSQFDGAMDWVVMWIPTDSILEGATRVMPDLIEEAFTRHRVLLATPVTMIALVTGVATALRHEEQTEKLHKNALRIQEAGTLLYGGVRNHAAAYLKLGRQLNRVFGAYDDGVKSIQGNLIRGAHDMRELGAGDGGEIEEPEPLHLETRKYRSVELRDLNEAAD
ncbi:MAG: DNA recombination protein RmuC [Chloroflexi bacterium]|nr:DNA recombination protein RmuC [Chloroflexota bacterium]